MKKMIIQMCIGGILALCTPLAANESSIDPPFSGHATLKKVRDNQPKKADIRKTDDAEPMEEVGTDEPGNSEPAHEGGGIIVISGGALLLIIILLILFC